MLDPFISSFLGAGSKVRSPGLGRFPIMMHYLIMMHFLYLFFNEKNKCICIAQYFVETYDLKGGTMPFVCNEVKLLKYLMLIILEIWNVFM